MSNVVNDRDVIDDEEMCIVSVGLNIITIREHDRSCSVMQ